LITKQSHKLCSIFGHYFLHFTCCIIFSKLKFVSLFYLRELTYFLATSLRKFFSSPKLICRLSIAHSKTD
jgi:hypothetical protein